MTIQMDPVAFVRGGRADIRDDRWGGSQAVIELVADIPAESLEGIETFSHAEILFVFDRSPLADIVTGSRHPRGNPAWPRVGILRSAPRRVPTASGRRSSAFLARTVDACASRDSTQSMAPRARHQAGTLRIPAVGARPSTRVDPRTDARLLDPGRTRRGRTE